MTRPMDASVKERAPLRMRLRVALADHFAASMPLAWKVLVLWLATRVGYVAVAYLANILHLFQAGPTTPSGMIFSWDHFDTNWYLPISRLGYFSKLSANFFPLYPAAVGWVSWILGDGSGPLPPHPDRLRLLVAIGLSNLGLLVGLYAVARLAELDAEPGDRRAGVRAAWILLAYPFAIAFTTALAEGFFLALAALALLFARRGRWYWAAVAALLAALTKPFGALLAAPLLWEYGRQHGWWRWPPALASLGSLSIPGILRTLGTGVVVAAAAPVAVIGWFTYLYFRFGDFLLPLHDQLNIWGHTSMPPWMTAQLILRDLSSGGKLAVGGDNFLLPVETGLVVSFALITLVSIRRIPFAYTLYMAGLLYLDTAAPETLFPDLLIGTTRYLASAFPVFLILARWSGRRPWLETALISVGMMVQGTMAVAFFQSKLT